MRYEVRDAAGETVYEGESWPMARAALDVMMIQDRGCPQLHIRPENEKEPQGYGSSGVLG